LDAVFYLSRRDHLCFFFSPSGEVQVNDAMWEHCRGCSVFCF